jgi:ubiquinone/menaquinone biosynthesis C-methylase UbiE
VIGKVVVGTQILLNRMQMNSKRVTGPEEHELDDVQRAAQEQFSRQSHRYARGHVLEDVSDIRDALEGVTIPVPADVLDVATGAGHTGLFFASLGHHVTATDLSSAMLERVKEAAAGRGLTVELRQHPAEQLPYPDGNFDLVTCRVAAHHFSSPAGFVHEAARVLKPGGRPLLIDGSVEDGQPDAEEWMHQVEKLRDPSHVRLLIPGRCRELCRAAGLAVVQLTLTPFKQPDLEWYFETAATPPQNRDEVRRLVANAPASARRLFRLGMEDGKIVWWWQRLTLVARKPGEAST